MSAKKAQSILDAIEQFEQTGESVGLELRLSLSEVILQSLREKGWTQATLARRSGAKESFISRILHSNANCTLDTAGKLLHALEVRARFQAISMPDCQNEAATDLVFTYRELEESYGKAITAHQETTNCYLRAQEAAIG
jgi:ribosome-binding protein aMBF1 (putative translation factor)